MASYYVGDLCYVLTDDEWFTVCANDDFIPDADGDYDPQGYLDPDNCSLEDYTKGRPYYMLKTAFGDGCYRGSDGKDYSVDSGTIGCIAVADVADQDKLNDVINRGLGHLHEWDDFDCGSCGYDEGTLYFHELDIPT